jgi:putative membrane protein
MLDVLLPTLGNFLAHFVLALVLLIVFKFVYAFITPHDEWALISNNNLAASIGFAGAILGFALALAGVISNSVNLIDFAVWSVVALIAQLTAFAIVRFVFMPQVVSRIEQGEISAGVMLAVTSVAVGLLNAACMTY